MERPRTRPSIHRCPPLSTYPCIRRHSRPCQLPVRAGHPCSQAVNKSRKGNNHVAKTKKFSFSALQAFFKGLSFSAIEFRSGTSADDFACKTYMHATYRPPPLTDDPPDQGEAPRTAYPHSLLPILGKTAELGHAGPACISSQMQENDHPSPIDSVVLEGWGRAARLLGSKNGESWKGARASLLEGDD